MMPTAHFRIVILILLSAILLSGCEGSAVPLVPTDPPTTTATYTPSPTRTPGTDVTPTQRPTQVAQMTGGPSPTSLFGATRTPQPDTAITPTRIFDPNAPSIEFFTSDPLRVAPGETVTLFWSTRGVNNAVIYRLDSEGLRSQVYNVPPDGQQPINTRASERGVLRFAIGVGEGADYVEQTITIPLECPVAWFFSPAPEDCAIGAPVETRIVDQTMERGRMIFVEANNTVYVLFNDGAVNQSAWLSFENEYDPAIHPSREESAPLEWIQPVEELGYVWRNNNDVRNRLGLGIADGIEFDGFTQTSPASSNREIVYISGVNGVVLQLIPGNQQWNIIGAPR